MACIGDDDAVGYLNDIDEKFGKANALVKQNDRKLLTSEVDVTDDYYSEMIEVLKKVGIVPLPGLSAGSD